MPARDFSEANLPGTKVIDAWEGPNYYVFVVTAEGWSVYENPFIVVPDVGKIKVHSVPGPWFTGLTRISIE